MTDFFLVDLSIINSLGLQEVGLNICIVTHEKKIPWQLKCEKIADQMASDQSEVYKIYHRNESCVYAACYTHSKLVNGTQSQPCRYGNTLSVMKPFSKTAFLCFNEKLLQYHSLLNVL